MTESKKKERKKNKKYETFFLGNEGMDAGR